MKKVSSLHFTYVCNVANPLFILYFCFCSFSPSSKISFHSFSQSMADELLAIFLVVTYLFVSGTHIFPEKSSLFDEYYYSIDLFCSKNRRSNLEKLYNREQMRLRCLASSTLNWCELFHLTLRLRSEEGRGACHQRAVLVDRSFLG